MARQKKRDNLGLAIAVILNFIFVGLGQVYQGKKEAKWIIILGVIFALLSFVLIGIPLYIILWLYAQYNALKGGN